MRQISSLLIVLFVIVDCYGGHIDSFTTPQSTPASGLRGAVSGPGILGTERDVILKAEGSLVTIENGSLVYSTPTRNSITIEWDGVQGGDGSPDRARQLPVTDLTRGGAHDRFIVDITAITGEWAIGVGFSYGSTSYSSQAVFGFTSPGTVEFLFSDLSSSEQLVNVNGLHLRLSPEFAYQAIAIGAFQSVPEPSSWVLLGTAGLAAIFVWRRRRR